MTVSPIHRAPVVTDPTTGEIITPAELSDRIFDLAGRLERSAIVEKAKTVELGHVQDEYDKVYRRAYRASDAKSEKGRSVDAELACEDAFCPCGCNETLSLSTRVTVLKAETKALRDIGHSMRAVLSGLQSISSNTRSAMFVGGGTR